MGIRVHKVLGYGLTDVKTNENYEIVDPRFNDLENIWELTTEDYIHFLEAKQEAHKGTHEEFEFTLDIMMLKDIKLSDVAYCICYDIEYGLPNVFCIIPPSFYPSWRRYDNQIDWQEETYQYNQENRFQIFNDGIYPFNAIYMDKRTGERIESKNHMNIGRFIDITKKFSSFEGQEFTDEQFRGLVEITPVYQTAQELYENCVPIIPECITYFCEFCNIFKDKQTILELRPMLYVYWS